MATVQDMQVQDHVWGGNHLLKLQGGWEGEEKGGSTQIIVQWTLNVMPVQFYGMALCSTLCSFGFIFTKEFRVLLEPVLLSFIAYYLEIVI